VTFALTGSARERFTQSVHFSERARWRAKRRAAAVRQRETPAALRRYHAAEMRTPTPAEVDVVVDAAIAHDGEWKQAVQDEQWGVRNGTLYGISVLVEQHELIIARLDRIARAIEDLVVKDDQDT
jgi:hypothetical protein